jgi:NAD(P)-dependent dehydrogenase (short-subunit alcohol dehydrogenase family)
MTTLPSFDLDGRRALVTGGGSGLGLGISEALAGAGAPVAVLGRSDAADEAVARIDRIAVRAGVNVNGIVLPVDEGWLGR